MQPTLATAVVCIVALMGCVSVENVDVTEAEPVSAREMHARVAVAGEGAPTGRGPLRRAE